MLDFTPQLLRLRTWSTINATRGETTSTALLFCVPTRPNLWSITKGRVWKQRLFPNPVGSLVWTPDPSFPLFYKKRKERVWAFSYGAHGSWNVRGLHKRVVIAVNLSGCLPFCGLQLEGGERVEQRFLEAGGRTTRRASNSHCFVSTLAG